MAKLYPPIVKGAQSPFYYHLTGDSAGATSYTSVDIEVQFTWNRSVSFSDVDGIVLRVKSTVTGKQILLAEASFDDENNAKTKEAFKTGKTAGITFTSISSENLKVGNFYKIQVAYYKILKVEMTGASQKQIGYFSNVGVSKFIGNLPKVKAVFLEDSLSVEYVPPESDPTEKMYSVDLALYNNSNELVDSVSLIHNSELDELGERQLEQWQFDQVLCGIYSYELVVKTISGLCITRWYHFSEEPEKEKWWEGDIQQASLRTGTRVYFTNLCPWNIIDFENMGVKKVDGISIISLEDNEKNKLLRYFDFYDNSLTIQYNDFTNVDGSTVLLAIPKFALIPQYNYDNGAVKLIICFQTRSVTDNPQLDLPITVYRGERAKGFEQMKFIKFKDDITFLNNNHIKTGQAITGIINTFNSDDYVRQDFMDYNIDTSKEYTYILKVGDYYFGNVNVQMANTLNPTSYDWYTVKINENKLEETWDTFVGQLYPAMANNFAKYYTNNIFSLENINGLNYSVTYEYAFIQPYFEDLFLADYNRQLKIRFNAKISTYKNTIQEQKLETIGSKYPFIFRNGMVAYKEIQLGGLISYLEDEERLFIYHTQIPKKGEEGWTTFPTDENILAERIFREQVIEWLQNGEAKLFKSPTEGNYILRLVDINLTPQEEIGRLIYQFTATGYEIQKVDSYIIPLVSLN